MESDSDYDYVQKNLLTFYQFIEKNVRFKTIFSISDGLYITPTFAVKH